MTPTLMGRWQTRILLLIFIGVPVTLIFALIYAGTPGMSVTAALFSVLLGIFLVGMILDVAYIQVQSVRWEQDWPFAFQLIASIIEFLIIVALIGGDFLRYAPSEILTNPDLRFILISHFSVVLLLSILALLGPLQVFLLRWRFKGGEIGRM